MEFAKKIEGAVFFIDILGFGALTRNQIMLSEKDFLPWLESHKQNLDFVEYNNQFLAASILSTFRNILYDLKHCYPDVKIAQLSDCAFIWSENIADIVLFANNFMCRAIREGLLCRGGMSYGEIIETETNDNNSLGQFILGEAVSNAVELEKAPKGCRILIDQNFPSHLSNHNTGFASQIFGMFQPFVNPLNYSVYDEFKWYLIPDMNKNTFLTGITVTDAVQWTIERLSLATELRFGPKYSWNDRSKEGSVQIKASIDFLTEWDEKFLQIAHEFRWSAEDIYSETKRSYEKCLRVKEIIRNLDNYKKVLIVEEENKIIKHFYNISLATKNKKKKKK